MDRIVLEKIKKDKLFEYFKLNSFYIKELNRNPAYYDTLKKILKEKYNLRITDKVSNVINDIELVSSIVSSIN
ncbi:MAG: hypothetical protein ACI4XM_02420 [Candidatus Coprovivens sp.]